MLRVTHARFRPAGRNASANQSASHSRHKFPPPPPVAGNVAQAFSRHERVVGGRRGGVSPSLEAGSSRLGTLTIPPIRIGPPTKHADRLTNRPSIRVPPFPLACRTQVSISLPPARESKRGQPAGMPQTRRAGLANTVSARRRAPVFPASPSPSVRRASAATAQVPTRALLTQRRCLIGPALSKPPFPFSLCCRHRAPAHVRTRSDRARSPGPPPLCLHPRLHPLLRLHRHFRRRTHRRARSFCPRARRPGARGPRGPRGPRRAPARRCPRAPPPAPSRP
jgi:hypothetical protein